MDYAILGNEKLKPLAIGADQKAIDELARRGNVLNQNDQLVKTTTQTIRNRTDKGVLISTDVIVREITDGQLTSVKVNGTPRPIATEGLQ